MALDLRGPLSKKDFLVRTHRPRCFSNGHDVVDVMAIAMMLTPENKIIRTCFSGAYCKTCNRYFILKPQYELFHKYGKFLCTTAEEIYYDDLFLYESRDVCWNDASVLKYMGYNVDQRYMRNSEQRVQILINLIENHIMTKFEILTYLNQFIEQHYDQQFFEKAVAKWQLDFDNLMNYIPKYSENVGINEISCRKPRLYDDEYFKWRLL